MTDPILIKQFEPIEVFPPIITPGQICEFFPIVTSCSIIAPELIIQLSLILEPAFIIQ